MIPENTQESGNRESKPKIVSVYKYTYTHTHKVYLKCNNVNTLLKVCMCINIYLGSIGRDLSYLPLV